MADCIDTFSWSSPLEGIATRLSRVALRVAKWTDRFAATAFMATMESRHRASERHLLATLDDRMLKDLCLSRADIEREIRKPFWVK